MGAASIAAKKAFSKVTNTGLSIGSVVGVGINGTFAVGDYNDMRDQGAGVGESMLSAGADFALGYVLGPWAYLGYSIAKELPGAIVSGAETMGQMSRSMTRANLNKPFSTAQFEDSQQAFTMRQAGMQTAQKAKYALNQAILGNEARYLHR